MSLKKDFVKFCIENGVLRFGDFTLKSGRHSPYFFNTGLFNTGKSMYQLGHYYARTMVDAKLSFDTLFGPAYKGIPLALACSMALSNEFSQDKPFCFNRKEAKNHGEGGQLVGASLKGDVVLLDDVITAGTAINEVKPLIEQSARLATVVIALDRQEVGPSGKSAIKSLEEQGIQVLSIICLDDIVAHLRESDENAETLEAIKQYQNEYGVQS